MDTKRGHPAGGFNFLDWRRLIKLICLVGIVPGLFISACDSSSQDSIAKSEAKENTIMESTIATSNVPRQIPPVELSQPEQTETATFAMG